MVTAITCSRGVKLLADAPLVEVADGEYDVIVLLVASKAQSVFAIAPCWLKPLNSSTVRAYRRGYLRRASHRAGPARYLPDWQYDRLPDAEDKIPAEQWQDKRVVWDARVKC